MKRTIILFITLVFIMIVQTATFAGNIEIQNTARNVVAEIIINDMTEMGLSKISGNDSLLLFKGNAENLMAPSTGKEFRITFTLIQSNTNVKISTDITNVLWDSYLDELKARFNGRWTFGVLTEPRKDAYFEISAIILNSSAAKEGLKKGDRITRINNSSIFDFDRDLNSFFKKAPEKSILTLEIETGGRKKTVTLEKSFIHGSLEYLQTK